MRIQYGKCMKCREITFITLAEDDLDRMVE